MQYFLVKSCKLNRFIFCRLPISLFFKDFAWCLQHQSHKKTTGKASLRRAPEEKNAGGFCLCHKVHSYKDTSSRMLRCLLALVTFNIRAGGRATERLISCPFLLQPSSGTIKIINSLQLSYESLILTIWKLRLQLC